jgi:hypothetical protein
MSRFFNVTLDKDIVLDDNVTNSSTGWTGEKILREILNHRITRFEQLDDVDVINKEDKQIVVYSGDTEKFTTVDLEQIGEAAGLSLKQIAKMGINGTTAAPYIVDIPISTLDFKVPRINILRWQLGDQNVIKTQNSFSNGESNTFQSDDMIIFDGTVHLKNIFTFNFNYERDVDTKYKEYSVPIDKSKFKNIGNLNISTDNILTMTATPIDRILIPLNDMNVSNASNIDYFNLIATGNIKVICSADSGITWKTFKNNEWVSINLDVSEMSANGIDVGTFNSISSLYWNLLVSAGKIRFAYLIQDGNSIDELKIQYDGLGFWIETKQTDYDVVYSSNSLLQVKLYFSGDVKINY